MALRVVARSLFTFPAQYPIRVPGTRHLNPARPSGRLDSAACRRRAAPTPAVVTVVTASGFHHRARAAPVPCRSPPLTTNASPTAAFPPPTRHPVGTPVGTPFAGTPSVRVDGEVPDTCSSRAIAAATFVLRMKATHCDTRLHHDVRSHVCASQVHTQAPRGVAPADVELPYDLRGYRTFSWRRRSDRPRVRYHHPSSASLSPDEHVGVVRESECIGAMEHAAGSSTPSRRRRTIVPSRRRAALVLLECHIGAPPAEKAERIVEDVRGVVAVAPASHPLGHTPVDLA